MNEAQVAKMGMDMGNKALEVMSDLVQALIAALSDKSNREQQDVLKNFSEYVKNGGELLTTQCSPQAYEAFEAAAKAADLTFYAAMDQDNGKVVIITKDKDMEKVMDISKEMAANEKPLFKDPQVPVAEYTHESDKQILYVSVDNYERIAAAKAKAAELGAKFAVSRKNDGTYMVICHDEDMPKLEKAGIVPQEATPMVFGQHTDLQDVHNIVEKRRKEKAEEQERAREAKKSKERE